MDIVLRKYGSTDPLYIDLYDPTDGQGETAAVFAAGDVTLSLDGANFANVTNLPVQVQSTHIYKWTPTAAETQAASIVLRVVDQDATKVWLDKSVLIETYGNALAMHAVDLDDSVRAGLTALPNAAAGAAGGLPTDSAGKTSFNDPTAAAIADQVWDEPRSGHVTIGSFGEGVASVQGNVTGSIGSLGTQAKADVNAEVDSALNTAIPVSPTPDSINERIKTIDDKLPIGIISDFNEATDQVIVSINNDKTGYRLSAAGVDDILDEAISEPTGVFSWAGATLRNIVGWLGALSRNKITQTSTTTTLRNDADIANISTSSVSDDGTTATRGKWQ